MSDQDSWYCNFFWPRYYRWRRVVIAFIDLRNFRFVQFTKSCPIRLRRLNRAIVLDDPATSDSDSYSSGWSEVGFQSWTGIVARGVDSTHQRSSSSGTNRQVATERTAVPRLLSQEYSRAPRVLEQEWQQRPPMAR